MALPLSILKKRRQCMGQYVDIIGVCARSPALKDREEDYNEDDI